MKAAACVVVRNEQNILPEWIAYHLVAGFDAAIVFDNCSTDATPDIVRSAGQHGDVRLFDWPFTHGRRQTDAYVAACREFAGEFDWMALIDADEFLLPMRHRTVKQWLSQEVFDKADAIAVNWAMFGSSGHETIPEGLVMENYCRRAWDNHGPNRHTKAIVRPGALKAMPNPHAVEVTGATVDALGEPVVWGERHGLAKQVVGLKECRINHYFTRSREDWARRLQRGQVTRRSWEDFAAYDTNELEDESILRHLERTRDMLTALQIGQAKQELPC
jgi:glycosyltransferase involved in cell wall biosynthesis